MLNLESLFCAKLPIKNFKLWEKVGSGICGLILVTISIASSPSFAVDPDVQYIAGIMAKFNGIKAPEKLDDTIAEPHSIETKIVQYLSSQNDTVLIDGGKDRGIVDGALFNSFRRQSSQSDEKKSVWVNTGKLKALRVEGSFTLAQVVGDGDALAKAFFPKHAIPMSGDVVAEASVKIAKNPIMTPSQTLLYQDIFADPKSNPTSFELTDKGKTLLRQVAKNYTKMRVPVLMVEGYTDQNGPEDVNQVESYQRALTVRQFIIEELGFEPSRIIAIGYGESQLKSKTMVDGYREQNRRIVFKVNVQISNEYL